MTFDSAFIIGADEVGMGCYAGPVVVGAVRAPKDWALEGLNDSKKLSEKRLDVMSAKLIELAKNGEISFAIAERSNNVIDTIGLAPAQKEAYIQSIQEVWQAGDTVILDGQMKLPANKIDVSRMISIVKADSTVPAVMAASILAKVYRDRKMVLLHDTYPVYNFASNVGYGTAEHREALEKHGPCAIHRFSYKPIKALVYKVS